MRKYRGEMQLLFILALLDISLCVYFNLNKPNDKVLDKTRFEEITKTKAENNIGYVPISEQMIEQKKIEEAKKKEEERKKKQEEERKKQEQIRKAKQKAQVKQQTQVKQTYVSTDVNEMKNYAHNLVVNYGWTEEDYNAWVQIINHESSWRVNAENPKSHAYGLCQSLPGSKMASAGSDWRTNYKTQLNWCASYIKGRYGTPSSAWNFWQQHHWY